MQINQSNDDKFDHLIIKVIRRTQGPFRYKIGILRNQVESINNVGKSNTNNLVTITCYIFFYPRF